MGSSHCDSVAMKTPSHAELIMTYSNQRKKEMAVQSRLVGPFLVLHLAPVIFVCSWVAGQTVRAA